MPEYEGYYDPYKKKEDEFDAEEREEDEIDADDRANDISNAIEEASGKLTRMQEDAMMDALDTISSHYDDNPKEGAELFDKLERILDKIVAADPEERIDKEDEYDRDIEDVNDKAQHLGEE